MNYDMSSYESIDSLTSSMEGNINRMCVTKDMKELDDMFEWLMLRARKLYIQRRKELGK